LFSYPFSEDDGKSIRENTFGELCWYLYASHFHIAGILLIWAF